MGRLIAFFLTIFGSSLLAGKALRFTGISPSITDMQAFGLLISFVGFVTLAINAIGFFHVWRLWMRVQPTPDITASDAAGMKDVLRPLLEYHGSLAVMALALIAVGATVATRDDIGLRQLGGLGLLLFACGSVIQLFRTSDQAISRGAQVTFIFLLLSAGLFLLLG